VANNISLLYLVFPISATVVNIAMKIYADRLRQKMASSQPAFIIFGTKTEADIKEEEKFSFSIGSVVGFPAVILLTFLTTFGSRKIRLLFFFPIQVSLISWALPCFIILNNSKIKRRASNQTSAIFETLKLVT
jgi:hypothetical protein